MAVVMPFLIAGALLTQHRVTVSLPAADTSHHDEETTVLTPRPAAASDDADEDGFADVLGNPVSAAVAKYKFDSVGSLYEVHSPQTELPRLGSPKS